MRVRTILIVSFVASSTALAQDATVKVKHGDVIVIGDAGGSVLTIDDAGLAAGQLRIAPAVGSTVNGSASALVVNGFTRDLRLVLRGGDDHVDLQGITIPRDLKCDGGTGADQLTGADVSVSRGLTITDTNGDSVIDFMSLVVAAAARIRTGAGNDSIELQGNVSGALKIDASAGDDQVALTAAQVGRTAKFDLGSGVNDLDIVSTLLKTALRVRAGSAADSLGISIASIARRTSIDLGGGGDTIDFADVSTASDVELSDVAKWTVTGASIGRSARCAAAASKPIETHWNALVVAGDIRLVGGSKADVVTADVNSEVDGGLRMELGSGDNSIDLIQIAVFGDLRIFTGDGDDTISLAGASVGGATKVKHGGGNDVVTP